MLHASHLYLQALVSAATGQQGTLTDHWDGKNEFETQIAAGGTGREAVQDTSNLVGHFTKNHILPAVKFYAELDGKDPKAALDKFNTYLDAVRYVAEHLRLASGPQADAQAQFDILQKVMPLLPQGFSFPKGTSVEAIFDKLVTETANLMPGCFGTPELRAELLRHGIVYVEMYNTLIIQLKNLEYDVDPNMKPATQVTTLSSGGDSGSGGGNGGGNSGGGGKSDTPSAPERGGAGGRGGNSGDSGKSDTPSAPER
jgi:hypothetical protein